MSRSTFFLSRSRFLKSRFFSRDFDASRFSRFVEMQSRFVKTLSRFVEKSRHCRGLLSLKMMKSLDGLRNLDEKIQKSMHFLIEIETNCRETPKFSDLDKILDLNWDFLAWMLMSRLTFWRCQDFLDRRDSLFDDVETNRDPHAYNYFILKKVIINVTKKM